MPVTGTFLYGPKGGEVEGSFYETAETRTEFFNSAEQQYLSIQETTPDYVVCVLQSNWSDGVTEHEMISLANHRHPNCGTYARRAMTPNSLWERKPISLTQPSPPFVTETVATDDATRVLVTGK